VQVSTTINNAVTHFQTITNNLTYIQNLTPSNPNIADYQYVDNYNDIVNDIASTTQIENTIAIHTITNTINTLSVDQVNNFGLSDLQSFLASSTLIASSTQYEADFSALSPASTTEQAQIALNLYSAVNSEISSVVPMLNSAVNQIQNANSMPVYQNIPELAMNANSILSDLAQSLTFNQLVQNIFGQASQYSDADSQLTQIANLNCGLKKENKEDPGTLLDQIHEAWSPPQGTFGDISGKLFQYIPFVCQSIDQATSNCKNTGTPNNEEACNIYTYNNEVKNIVPITYVHLGGTYTYISVVSPSSTTSFTVAFNTGNFIENSPTTSISLADWIQNYASNDYNFPSQGVRSVEELLRGFSGALSQTTGTNLPDISCHN
jgi:hypothetical protein